MTLCIPSLPSPSPYFIFWFSFHFSRDQNRKSPYTVFFCFETKRKRLLRRLDSVACVSSFDDGASVDFSGFCTGFSCEVSVPCAICPSTTRQRKLWKVTNLRSDLVMKETPRASINDSYTKYYHLQLSAAAQTKR